MIFRCTIHLLAYFSLLYNDYRKRSYHRCRSMQIFGGAKHTPEFPQTSPKSFCAIFAYKSSPTNIMKTFLPFLVWPSKKVFMCFCVFLQTLGAIFQTKQSWAPFLTGFLGILPRFSTNQNFWGCACTPTSYTTGSCQWPAKMFLFCISDAPIYLCCPNRPTFYCFKFTSPLPESVLFFSLTFGRLSVDYCCCWKSKQKNGVENSAKEWNRKKS